jgi:hypothetical protein
MKSKCFFGIFIFITFGFIFSGSNNLNFLSSELFAQSSSAQESSGTTQRPSDINDKQKDLKLSGSPTYIDYIDPKTGEKTKKKVYYGFQYGKEKKEAEPIGDKRYSTPGSEESDGVGRRWGWQYPGAAQIRTSSSSKQKAPEFKKVTRTPIQVDGDPTGSVATDQKSNKPGEAPKLTPEMIQEQIFKMAKEKRKK